MYYARQRVGNGGLVLAPAVTRVQVLRSQDFCILINRSYRAFEGRWWLHIVKNLSWADTKNLRFAMFDVYWKQRMFWCVAKT